MIKRDQDPIVIDAIPSHLAVRFTGKARSSDSAHLERERGFRPDRNGDAQVLLEQEPHLESVMN
jgi:hypothetical protein